MNLSVMIDLVTAGTLFLFTVLGWKRGLVRTLAELLVVIVALVLSVQIARTAAPKLVDAVLRPAAYEAIESRIEELDLENALDGALQEAADRLVEAIPNQLIREQALRLLEEQTLPVPVDGTKEAVLELSRRAVDAALDGVVRELVQSVLCAAAFVVLTVLLRVAARVLRIVEKLPGIRQLNELGGALVGLGKGAVLVCLGLWVLRQTGVIPPEAAAGSLALRWLGQWSGGLLG